MRPLHSRSSGFVQSPFRSKMAFSTRIASCLHAISACYWSGRNQRGSAMINGYDMRRKRLTKQGFQ